MSFIVPETLALFSMTKVCIAQEMETFSSMPKKTCVRLVKLIAGCLV